MLFRTFHLAVRSLTRNTRISSEFYTNIHIQKYSKWAPRQPVAIVNEDELFDVDVKNVSSKSLTKQTNTLRKSRINRTRSKNKPNSTKEKDDDATKNSIPKKYSTKIEDNKKILTSVMMTIQMKKKRKKQEQIIIEGKRFIMDAVEAGVKPEIILFSRFDDVEELQINDQAVKFYKVPYRSLQLWSTLTTTPGIMGIFKRPSSLSISKSALPITIICDNVRDPGNMGSILRTAAGAGCEKIILLKGCVDYWDTKVLRSAAGAHFRIPIFGAQEWDEINSVINPEAQVYVADNNINPCNEEVDELITEENDVTEINSDTTLEDIKGMIDTETNEKEKVNKQEKYQSKKKMMESMLLDQVQKIPVVPYHTVEYTSNEVILIVGGETEGLSQECLSFVQEKNGLRVNIPLENKIDSLNVGTALGIITFEMKRQFTMIQRKLNLLQQ